jgi:hypothetical protein
MRFGPPHAASAVSLVTSALAASPSRSNRFGRVNPTGNSHRLVAYRGINALPQDRESLCNYSSLVADYIDV